MKGRLIPWMETTAAENMAIDEALLLLYRQDYSPITLRFYGWKPRAISLGYSQDIKKEIDLKFCKRLNLDLVRRPTGGRTVLHDDEITYSLVAGKKDGFSGNLMRDYRKIATGIREGFAGLGVEISIARKKREIVSHPKNSYANKDFNSVCFAFPSWYEITYHGKKLVGSAQVRRDNGFLQHGSILLSFSPEILLKTVGVEPSQPKIEALKKKIVALSDILGVYPERDKIIDSLVLGLADTLSVDWEIQKLTTEELYLVKELMKKKYQNVEWNYQRIEGRRGQG